MTLRFVEHRNINLKTWDDCIALANPALVYAQSWYLDAMCDGHWNALILDDYRAVMPLPYLKKWGISYLSQPAFTQQLGIFGHCSEEETELFLKAIPGTYRLADLQFHTATPASLPGLKPRVTYWLDLNRPYETLLAGYNKDARKNLRRLEELSGPCTLADYPDFGWHIANYRAAYGPMNPELTERHYRRFQHALEAAWTQRCLIACRLLDRNGRALAGGLFLKSKQHLHYVMGAPVQGADSGGVHGMIDALIRRHAHTPTILDFEGSEIPSVAYFYAKFGAQPVHYYTLRLNRLPCWLAWLKK